MLFSRMIGGEVKKNNGIKIKKIIGVVYGTIKNDACILLA